MQQDTLSLIPIFPIFFNDGLAFSHLNSIEISHLNSIEINSFSSWAELFLIVINFYL